MRAGTFNILVGVDFSDSSAGALEWALMLSERIGAVLHMAHLTPVSGGVSAPTDLGLNIPDEHPEAQHARERLESLRVLMGARFPTVPIELHLRMGDSVQGLLTLTHELRPAMVVVGSHGHGAVRSLIGSVSAQLTRLSPAPVLVVPDPRRLERMQLPQLDKETLIEPALPSVASKASETLDSNRTNDSSSGSVNISPSGMGGLNVNPELRVRY